MLLHIFALAFFVTLRGSLEVSLEVCPQGLFFSSCPPVWTMETRGVSR
jgi:hypothetical protein